MKKSASERQHANNPRVRIAREHYRNRRCDRPRGRSMADSTAYLPDGTRRPGAETLKLRHMRCGVPQRLIPLLDSVIMAGIEMEMDCEMPEALDVPELG